ncbi:uncharacterized protein LOC132644009 isoform X1 [Lycium barbarum]|uniref:uncharacterized protein LOC132644009 isoform X1 n=1 Tax=Lycium barbarum TaxID=112863 RepID=UPI00293F460A|nr:uncharacterized protein LOC132644009 isoform X1 [Lycium barbarum]
MALSSLSPPKHVATQSTYSIPKLYYSHSTTLSFPAIQNPHNITTSPLNQKWRTHVSFFPAFFNKTKDATHIKQELLEAIAPLDRGAEASPEDQEIIDQIAGKLEVCNPTKEPLKSSLLNGKWELIYTTSKSILQTQRPKILRSRVNYQAINVDTLRAQNMEGWPFFNQTGETGDRGKRETSTSMKTFFRTGEVLDSKKAKEIVWSGFSIAELIMVVCPVSHSRWPGCSWPLVRVIRYTIVTRQDRSVTLYCLSYGCQTVRLNLILLGFFFIQKGFMLYEAHKAKL